MYPPLPRQATRGNFIDKRSILDLYRRLLDSYGEQHWWPAQTAFEVMVGAILTQNTSWRNVVLAINKLRESNKLCLSALSKIDEGTLATLIRPCGYYNVKARRLKNLCRWLQENGGIEKLGSLDTGILRNSLLQVNGIGQETADDILLYALERPVFVIDTYTRRLMATLGWIEGNEDYEFLRNKFEIALGYNVALYNEYHALIVRHAKEKCSREIAGNSAGCKHCFVENTPAIKAGFDAAGFYEK